MMKTDLQSYHRPQTPLNQSQLKAKESLDLKVSKPIKPVKTETPKVPNTDVKVDISPSAKLQSISLPKPSLEGEAKSEAVKEVLKTKTEELKPSEQLKRPAIFFVKGMDLFSQYGGITKMGESVRGARVYGWDQKSDMLNEIKKTHPSQPIILVGHSLGGDTVHEIADELDTIEEKFRKIDLLITIDSVGSSHDIIPQNVKKHLNVFSEKGMFSDGPHVARNNELTKVENHLSPYSHTELDDEKSIQYQVLTAIKDVLPPA